MEQKWGLWTEPKKTTSNVAYRQFELYCSLQGFSVDFTYLFLWKFQWGNIALWGVWKGPPWRSHALPQRHLQVIFTLLPPLIIHFVLCLPWLELSISLVWKVQDITCLIKNIDSNVPAQRENVKHGPFARFTAHCTCRHSTLHHSFWTLRFLSSGQTCVNGHAWTTNCDVTHFQHNQIFAHPFLSVSSDIDWLNGGNQCWSNILYSSRIL